MLFSLLVLAAVPQGQVHVVDAADGPGADFTEIRDAVAAAADGDVVLVRDGDYRFSAGSFVEGVRLDGRGLTVVAEAGADVRTQSLLVENLPAASQVLVQGVRFVSSPFDSRFDANQGPVWLERCILGPNGCVCVLEREYALHATDCAAVVVSRCSLSAPLNDFAEGTAILAEDSRLHVWESDVLGFSFGEFEALGAITLREGAFLELFGSSVMGGDSYDSISPFQCDGRPGGDAVWIEGGSTLVRLASHVEGGAGGAPYNSSCSAGDTGIDVLDLGGEVVSLSGTARSLEVPSPVREGEGVAITTTGLPGDRVWVKYSFVPGTGIASPLYDGENMLGPQRFRAYRTTLPDSGTAVFTAPAPELGPGRESLVVYCQAFFLDQAGTRFVVSSPSACVVLDESF